MYDVSQALIVVYKDEMLLNQFKKLVETKDDTKDQIIGIRDGSIKIVAWNQKTWLDQKKAGNITSKVLFLGDVQGTDKLIPVLDVKFSEYGAKYGWAGNQAAIYAIVNEVEKDEVYKKFLRKLCELPIPDSLKENKKTYLEVKRVKLLDRLAKEIQGVFDNRPAIMQQLLIYAVFKFHYNSLKDFIEA